MTGSEVANHLARLIRSRDGIQRRGRPEQHLEILNEHGDEIELALFDGNDYVQFFRLEVHEYQVVEGV